ncbi:Rz1-like lysis system protein LysC [Stutzerimonas frequens]|uniref:Rz1-like lysis system protein LysC n=1 Tax=Stutzerimonas frequens TaxID=2968969 RepID=UPI002934A558|nr:Rz1-like lysis system protein LysC [Stutzerimonas frequens]WOC77634.1 Rz1-like lysis system protein LysC [Stutzerimonas frequens]
MKTQPMRLGLLSLCLMLLAACTNVPPSPEPQVTVSGCPVVTRCTLDPSAPASNGELSDDGDYLMAAWGECAAKVDLVVDHNARSTQP